MSMLEIPLTRRFCKESCGTLVDEVPAVRGTDHNAPRSMAGVIILGGETRPTGHEEVAIAE